MERFKTGRRRGVVLVFTLVMLVVLLGFAALTLDIGALYNTRTDLQNAADAAALAGGSALTSDAMRSARGGGDSGIAGALILERAGHAGLLNASFGAGGTVIPPDDVISGWIDLKSGTSPIDPGRPFGQHNAVQVCTRRTRAGANGPVRFFFAAIFGKRDGEVTASAAAAFDDRVSGYDPGAGPLWPFTISLAEYNAQAALGIDGYDYDGGSVLSGEDGLPEVNFYPRANAPGNFGALNIGRTNQGTPGLADHIKNNVPPEDIEDEIGTGVISFYVDGKKKAYSMTGDPGLSASLESAVRTRIGDVIGVFVHARPSRQERSQQHLPRRRNPLHPGHGRQAARQG